MQPLCGSSAGCDELSSATRPNTFERSWPTGHLLLSTRAPTWFAGSDRSEMTWHLAVQKAPMATRTAFDAAATGHAAPTGRLDPFAERRNLLIAAEATPVEWPDNARALSQRR